NELDIFEKLRQSYLLQIELLQKHPWIFEFIKISATTKSDDINQELENRENEKLSRCQETMFTKIDESKFREGLNVEKSKQFILWANVGFTNQMLKDIRNEEMTELNYDEMVEKLDDYLNELRKIFYQ